MARIIAAFLAFPWLEVGGKAWQVTRKAMRSLSYEGLYEWGVDECEPKPLFDLDQVVGTPGALQALEKAEEHPVELFARHVTGD